MPDLQGQQFAQPEIEGWAEPFHSYRSRMRRVGREDDPGPYAVRGEIGMGQRILNLDYPGRRPLEHREGGLIPVHEGSDPDYEDLMWRFGGAQRGENRAVEDRWDDAPVENIAPETQIRTGQQASGWYDDEPDEVQFGNEDMIEDLRRAGSSMYLPPGQSRATYPWIGRVAGKNYLLEGHHRVTAARTSRSGEFLANVIEAPDWDAFGREFDEDV